MKLTHFGVSLDRYHYPLLSYSNEYFIQWKETIRDTYLTYAPAYTPSCFLFIEPNISLLPQGSLAIIPSNALSPCKS